MKTALPRLLALAVLLALSAPARAGGEKWWHTWFGDPAQDPRLIAEDEKLLANHKIGVETAALLDYLRWLTPGKGDEKEAESMRVRMDEGADALYIRFEESPIVESEEVSPGVILDFDRNGRVVGLEMLNVRQRLPGADLKRVEVEVA